MKQLVTLLNGDTRAAAQLVLIIRRKHPQKSDQVCFEDAISALMQNQLPSRIQLESVNYRGRYIRHRNSKGYIEQTSSEDASFRQRPGLANPNCVSFESINYPDHFLRHQNFRIVLSVNDGNELFKQDASFYRNDLSTEGVSFESYNYRGRYIRHRNYELWLDKFDGSDLLCKDASFRYQFHP